MEDFNFFNNNNSGMLWDINFPATDEKNFRGDFDMQSVNSHIFMESSTKPSEMVDLPRFYFPNCNEEEQVKPKDTSEEEAKKEESKDTDLFMNLVPAFEELEISSKQKVSQDSKSSNFEKFDDEESQRSIKKRWNRKKDKLLFQVIRSLEDENKLSLQEFLVMDPTKDACSSEAVNILTKKFGWKSLKKYLVVRIQSLCRKGFSVRETKSLKRIIKKDYNYKDLDYKKILYEFPGKSVEKLQEVCEEIIQRKFKKTLTDYCLKQR